MNKLELGRRATLLAESVESDTGPSILRGETGTVVAWRGMDEAVVVWDKTDGESVYAIVPINQLRPRLELQRKSK